MKSNLRLLTASVLAGALFLPSASYAERYVVEKDSFGGFSASKVRPSDASQDKTSSVDQSASDDAVSESAVSESAGSDSTVSENSSIERSSDVGTENVGTENVGTERQTVAEPAQATTNEVESSKASQEAETASKPEELNESAAQHVAVDPFAKQSASEGQPTTSDAPKVEAGVLGDVGESFSPFEQEFLENERREKARVLKGLQDAPVLEEYDATKVNPAEFVDGDELLKGGGLRVKERAPYYSVIEADGTIRNEFYDPAAIQEALDEKYKKKIELTEAQVYTKEDAAIALPKGADPVAASLLGGANTSKSYFESFAQNCCSRLPNTEVVEMNMGNKRYFELTRDNLPYRFSEGDSRYLLIALPKYRKDYPIKLRSYIRSHRKLAIEHGVFFPQLITLDKDKNPLRIFTGPLLRYHEETWTTHGFLEGFFEISQAEDLEERYLLVNSTKEAMSQSSSIEGEEGEITIEHMGMGSIEVEILARED